MNALIVDFVLVSAPGGYACQCLVDERLVAQSPTFATVEEAVAEGTAFRAQYVAACEAIGIKVRSLQPEAQA